MVSIFQKIYETLFHTLDITAIFKEIYETNYNLKGL